MQIRVVGARSRIRTWVSPLAAHRGAVVRPRAEPEALGPRFALRGRLQHGVAVGAVGPEWPAAVQGLLELVGLAVVELRARIVRAVAERIVRSVEREPRVDAERAAVAGTVGRTDEGVAEHLGLAAGVGDHRPLAGRRTAGEGDRLDLQRAEPEPVRLVEGVTEGLAGNAELARRLGVRGGVPDLPDERVRGVVD